MPRMPYDLPLRCQCGHVRGAARDVSPSAGFRFVCYCTDCQAFARFLARQDVLDAAGGTDIFQMPAGRVTLIAGADALRCLTFSGKVLRWYAECCRTPIANAAVTSRFPVVALIHSFMNCGDRCPRIPAPAGIQAAGTDILASRPGPRLRGSERIMRNEVLGPPLCRIYERSATGPLPPDAPPPPSFGIFMRRASKILSWWLRGLGRPNPFFDAHTGAPLSAPRIFTPGERAALD